MVASVLSLVACKGNKTEEAAPAVDSAAMTAPVEEVAPAVDSAAMTTDSAAKAETPAEGHAEEGHGKK